MAAKPADENFENPHTFRVGRKQSISAYAALTDVGCRFTGRRLSVVVDVINNGDKLADDATAAAILLM